MDKLHENWSEIFLKIIIFSQIPVLKATVLYESKYSEKIPRYLSFLKPISFSCEYFSSYFNLHMVHFSGTPCLFLTLGSDLNNFQDDKTVNDVAQTIQNLINNLQIKKSGAIQ